MKTATVVQLKNIREHPNADRVNLVTIFGNQVVIGKNTKEGDLGLFFEIETELDRTFCKENNLFDNATLNKDGIKGYFSSKTPRVKVQNFRGARSEGFFMPLSSLDYTGSNDLKVGVEFQEINGHKICWKWINKNTQSKADTRQKSNKKGLVPLFKEHLDTKQFGRHIDSIKQATTVIITEKLHGTSGRAANTLIEVKPKWYQFWKQPKKEYSFTTGSRRVVKTIAGIDINKKGYYEEDIWSTAAIPFKDNLFKGETIYFEIVGYLENGQSIMGKQENKKLKAHLTKEDYKTFISSYGDVTDFHYNNPIGTHSTYVYRITMTNEDGIDYDLSWDQVKSRCGVLGVKYTPELAITNLNENLKDQVVKLSESPSSIFTGHIKEGVCIRIENGERNPIILKEKNFQFKVLENIIKESGAVDTEESN